MIHEPNTKKWRLGDVVIHDADAKKHGMLMRVTGTTKDGSYITRYLDRSVSPERCVNRMEALHDPARFAIAVPSDRHLNNGGGNGGGNGTKC